MDRRRFLKCLALGGGATAVGMASFGYGVERTAVEVSRFDVSPAPRGGLDVAFMSDFHLSGTTSRADLQHAVDMCNEVTPDVVLLGGDYVTDDWRQVHACAEVFAALRAPGGVFFVLGNHDHWTDAQLVREAMGSVGLIDLTNRNTELAPGLFLCGIDDYSTGRPDVEAALKGTDRGRRLVLTHDPRMFPRIRERSCLAMCGHTHGGQIDIPFVPNPYLKGWTTYIKGWFHEGSSSLYVNRGIGTLSLPIRFNCRPEITVVRV